MTSAQITTALFVPTAKIHLGVFYLFWMALYTIINIAWDIFTPKTPPFRVPHLRDKMTVLHPAATFASSLLLVIGIFSTGVHELAGDTMLPIVLAALSGLMATISELCPYEFKRAKSPGVRPQATKP